MKHTTTDAVFLIPTAGFDSYAVEGRGFHDPEADAAFIAALKANLPDHIRVIERETHIEEPEFAAEAAEHLITMIRKT